MYKAKEIEGVVYRVKHLTGGWLVEVPETEDPIEALATFAAEKSVKGYIITSVTRIFDCSKTLHAWLLSPPKSSNPKSSV